MGLNFINRFNLPTGTGPERTAVRPFSIPLPSYTTLTPSHAGPLFLIPGLVIGTYVTGTTLRPEQKTEMIRYLLHKRKPAGGWGLYVHPLPLSLPHASNRSALIVECKRHTAAPPTMFGTVMNYVSLRLLGLDPEMPVMQDTRAWIHEHGTHPRGCPLVSAESPY